MFLFTRESHALSDENTLSEIRYGMCIGPFSIELQLVHSSTRGKLYQQYTVPVNNATPTDLGIIISHSRDNRKRLTSYNQHSLAQVPFF